MARITYADKEQHHASPLPDEQKWMHGDANEVKESVNAIYDADQTTGGRLMLVADAPEGQVGSSPDLTAADNELNIGAEHGHGIVNLGNGGGSGSVSAIGVLNLEGGEVEVSGGSTVRLSTSGTVHVEIDENGALLVANEPGTSGQVLTSNGADNPPYWAEPDTDITPFLSIQSGSMSGTLREDGTNAGKAKFALVGGDPNLDLVAWSGSAWMVTVGGVVRYTSASDVATPDLATGWTATGGAQPLPVFSPVYGPQGQEAFEGLGMVGLEHRSAFEAPRTLWVNALRGNNDTAEVGKQYRPYATVQAAINAASALTAGNVHIYVLPGDYGGEEVVVPAGAPDIQDIRLMAYPGFLIANLEVEAGAFFSVDYLAVGGTTTVGGTLTTYNAVNLGSVSGNAGTFVLNGLVTATSISIGDWSAFVAYQKVSCDSFNGDSSEVALLGGIDAKSCDFADCPLVIDGGRIKSFLSIHGDVADVTCAVPTMTMNGNAMAMICNTIGPGDSTLLNVTNGGYAVHKGANLDELNVYEDCKVEAESANVITMGNYASCKITNGISTLATTGTSVELSINGGKIDGSGIMTDKDSIITLSNLVLVSSVQAVGYSGTEVRVLNCQSAGGVVNASFATRTISTIVT